MATISPGRAGFYKYSATSPARKDRKLKYVKTCTKCGSIQTRKGQVTKKGKQLYICNECGKFFDPEETTKRLDISVRNEIIKRIKKGESPNSIHNSLKDKVTLGYIYRIRIKINNGDMEFTGSAPDKKAVLARIEQERKDPKCGKCRTPLTDDDPRVNTCHGVRYTGLCRICENEQRTIKWWQRHKDDGLMDRRITEMETYLKILQKIKKSWATKARQGK